MDHPQQLELDGSHFSHSGWLIRSGASGPGAARDDEHGGGKWEQLPGIRPSPLGPVSFSGLLTTQTIFLRSDPRPTPSRLNSIRRLLRVYLSHGGFSHLITNVWKTCGEVAERRSEIRESWVVLTVED